MENPDNTIEVQYAMDNETAKRIALEVAWSFHGLPYIWGGDDPVVGFDCSGFVIEILKSCGKLPRVGDWRARDLYNKFKSCSVGRPHMGCLVFWGDGPFGVTHIEFCLNDALSIGASGGGSKTKSQADASKQNAYIKVRPMQTRAGIVGYVDPFKEVES